MGPILFASEDRQNHDSAEHIQVKKLVSQMLLRHKAYTCTETVFHVEPRFAMPQAAARDGVTEAGLEIRGS